MGNNESSLDKGIQQCVLSEYERVKKDKSRDYLILKEILNLSHPDDYPFTFAHIGNLFVLDENQDGRVNQQEILNFAMFCNKNLKNYKTYEFQSQLQAATTYELWKFIKSNEKENIEDIVAWIGRLLYENEEVSYFQNKPEIPFIKIDTLKLLYEIFNLKAMNGMDIQNFIDLLQQCGEENELMALECEELDEYVPLIICQEFAREFIKGLIKLMKEIGFDALE